MKIALANSEVVAQFARSSCASYASGRSRAQRVESLAVHRVTLGRAAADTGCDLFARIVQACIRLVLIVIGVQDVIEVIK